jgi:hypothetical protein
VPRDTRIRVLIGTFLAAVLGVGITVAVVDNGPDRPPGQPRRTITVTLGGPGHKQLELPPAAQAIVAQEKKDDAADRPTSESDLHETKPATPTQLKVARDVAPPGSPALPQNQTLATPSVPGCTTRLVRNYSARPVGARVLLGVIHWTGSRPISHSATDALAIVRWFDTPAADASSNEITDDDGHCYLVVPEAKKAWTQAKANPWSVSVEHINIGKLPVFPTAAGRRTVVRLMRHWHAAFRIPYQRGRVNQVTCVPIRPGFLAHRDLGPCGGGHPDIGTPSAVDALIREAAATDPSARPVTAADRATCRKLTWWRTHGRPRGKAERNAIRRRKALTTRHLTCAGGSVRRA